MTKTQSKFCTLRQASQLVGLSESTLRRLIALGTLTAYKPAGRVLLDEAALVAYVRRHVDGGGSTGDT